MDQRTKIKEVIYRAVKSSPHARIDMQSTFLALKFNLGQAQEVL
jgi:hypothetical protein